jgi:hypothetical protein
LKEQQTLSQENFYILKILIPLMIDEFRVRRACRIEGRGSKKDPAASKKRREIKRIKAPLGSGILELCKRYANHKKGIT